MSTSWTLEIWDALKAATKQDLTLAQAIVDSAGVIVQSADLTICYDERGKETLLNQNLKTSQASFNTPMTHPPWK